jgi:hypothetical protein
MRSTRVAWSETGHNMLENYPAALVGQDRPTDFARRLLTNWSERGGYGEAGKRWPITRRFGREWERWSAERRCCADELFSVVGRLEPT